jgi:hypothetical protein
MIKSLLFLLKIYNDEAKTSSLERERRPGRKTQARRRPIKGVFVLQEFSSS